MDRRKKDRRLNDDIPVYNPDYFYDNIPRSYDNPNFYHGYATPGNPAPVSVYSLPDRGFGKSPYERPYMYGSKQRLNYRQGSESTEQSRTSTKSRAICVALTVVFFVGISAGIGTVIYLTSQSSDRKDMPSTTNPPTTDSSLIEKAFDGILRVRQPWDDALNDTTSPHYISVKEEMEKVLNTIFEGSSLAQQYVRSQVTAITPGSRVYIFIAIFRIPDPTLPGYTTPLAGTELVPTVVGSVIQHAISSGSINQVSTSLTFDSATTISITEKTTDRPTTLSPTLHTTIATSPETTTVKETNTIRETTTQKEPQTTTTTQSTTQQETRTTTQKSQETNSVTSTSTQKTTQTSQETKLVTSTVTQKPTQTSQETTPVTSTSTQTSTQTSQETKPVTSTSTQTTTQTSQETKPVTSTSTQTTKQQDLQTAKQDKTTTSTLQILTDTESTTQALQQTLTNKLATSDLSSTIPSSVPIETTLKGVSSTKRSTSATESESTSTSVGISTVKKSSISYQAATADSSSVLSSTVLPPTTTPDMTTDDQTTTYTTKTETQTTATTTTEAPEPVPVVFDGEIRINQTWDEKLNDTSSPEYNTAKTDFENMMDTLYRSSNLSGQYNRTEVTAILPGSRIYVYAIICYPVEDSKSDPETSTDTPSEGNITQNQTTPKARQFIMPSLQAVIGVFREAITSGKINEMSDSMKIDKTVTITMTERTTTTTTTTTTTRPSTTTETHPTTVSLTFTTHAASMTTPVVGAMFEGEIVIKDLPYHPDYSNPSSYMYKLMEDFFLNQTDAVFKNSMVQTVYIETKVMEIRPLGQGIMVRFVQMLQSNTVTTQNNTMMIIDSKMIKDIIMTEISNINKIYSANITDQDVTIREMDLLSTVQPGLTTILPTTIDARTTELRGETTTLSPTIYATTTGQKGCGGKLTDSYGEIKTPNYPFNYDSSAHCMWMITVTPGSIIQLNFVDFDLESGYDYLTVYDVGTGSILWRYSGTVNYKSLNSSSNSVMLNFTSDSSVTRKGFRVLYNAMLPPVQDCNYNQFPCPDDRMCLFRYQLCDGRWNCADGFDERHCDSSFSSTTSGDTTHLNTTDSTTVVTTPSVNVSSIEIRLVNGSNCFEGRVEVKYNDVWGTICSTNWDSSDASVVCRMLGLKFITAQAYFSGYFGSAEDSVPIWLDNMYCSGNEWSLAYCGKGTPWGQYSCAGHSGDAGVRCEGVEPVIAPFDHSIQVPTDAIKWCSFESFSWYTDSACSFYQRSNDVFDWTRDSGGTASSNTGPSSAYHGLYYLYLETSSPRVAGNNAVIESSYINTGNESCLVFHYHMYGATMGTLNVNISTASIVNRRIWYKSGQQNNQWNQAIVTLPSSIALKIKIEGITGSSYTGDMAIDHLYVVRRSCNTVTPVHTIHHCTFESSSWYYPYDSKCPLTRSFADQYYWSRSSTGTSTSGTGPTAAHGGNYFLYIESNYATTAANAIINVDLNQIKNGPVCLIFYYHMYGSTMGMLRVVRQYTNSNVTLWQKSGNQGNLWQQAHINILSGGHSSLYIEGIRGPGIYSDTAIDDVYVVSGLCQNTCPVINYTSVNCTFDGSACNYTSFDMSGSVEWLMDGYTGHGLQLPTDHTQTSNTGSFMYYQNLLGQEGDKAVLISPLFKAPETARLTFYYHMHGQFVGHLNVSLMDNKSGSVLSQLLYKEGDLGNQWYQFCSKIPSRSNISLRFEATRGVSGDNHIAVDDVSVSARVCPYGIADTLCDFGQPDICGYTINCTSCKQETPRFKWQRKSGSTSTKNSGPSTDYYLFTDPGRNFMFVEATHGRHGDSTALTFPEVNVTKTKKELQFYYHMYGEDVGSLIVQVHELSTSYKVSEWTLSGNQGSTWKPKCIDLSKFIGKNVQVSFIAVRGDGPFGDIAIDNVVFSDCSLTSPVTCNFDQGACDYKTVQNSWRWNPVSVSWQRVHASSFGSLPDYYFAVPNTLSPEGMIAMLASPVFSADIGGSVNLYFNKGSNSKLSVGYINASDILTSTEDTFTLKGTYTGYTSLWSTVWEAKNWTHLCLNVRKSLSNVVLVFVLECGPSDGGCYAAIDNVLLNKTAPCLEISGLQCSFDTPGQCKEEINSEGNCNLYGPPFSWYYWTNSSSSISDTVSDTGSFLYASSANGLAGDTTEISFPGFSAAENSSLKFHYNKNFTFINVPIKVNITWKGDYPQIYIADKTDHWREACIDLRAGEVEAVYISTTRSLDSTAVVAIDEVSYSTSPCPVPNGICNFDEDFCGYERNSRWALNETDSESFALVAGSSTYEMAIMQSPLVNMTSSPSCVQMKYVMDTFYAASITVRLESYTGLTDQIRTFSSKTTTWRPVQILTYMTQFYVVINVSAPYYQPYVIGIDDIQITEGTCPPPSCQTDEVLCDSKDACIKANQLCDGYMQCIDDSDEQNCTTSVTCEFNNSYICGYKVLGNPANTNHWYSQVDRSLPNPFYNPNVTGLGAVVLLSDGTNFYAPLTRLIFPSETVAVDSCLSFYTMSFGVYPAVLRAVQNATGTLSPLARFIYVQNIVWIMRRVNITAGNLDLHLELSSSLNTEGRYGVYIDSVVLTPGPCKQLVCDESEFYCSKDDMCIDQSLVCNQVSNCQDNQDELGCVFNISCDFEDKRLCGYTAHSNWTLTSQLPLTTQNFNTTKFLVIGSTEENDGNVLIPLRSPRITHYGTFCLSIDVAKVHPHPYSASFLLVRVGMTYSNQNQGQLEIKDFSLRNTTWNTYELTVNVYGEVTVYISATTYRAFIAVDDIKFTPCSSGTSTTTPAYTYTSYTSYTTSPFPNTNVMTTPTQSTNMYGCYVQRFSNFIIVSNTTYNTSYGTLSQCENECMNQIQCAGINYMHDFSQCQKYLRAQSFEIGFNTTVVIKFCPSTGLSTTTISTSTQSAGCHFERTSNFSIMGSAPYNTSYGTLRECEEECMTEIQCVGITYMHDNSQCHKYVEARYFNRAINTTAVIKFCPNTHPSTSAAYSSHTISPSPYTTTSITPAYTTNSYGCYFFRIRDVIINSSNPYNMSSGTQGQCEEECVKDTRCAAVTYMHDLSQCNRYPDSQSFHEATNTTMGIKLCSTSSMSANITTTPAYSTNRYGCYLHRVKDLAIVNGTLYNISNVSKTQCEEECMNETQCLGVTYFHDVSQCHKYLNVLSFHSAVNTTLVAKFCQNNSSSTNTVPFSSYSTHSSSCYFQRVSNFTIVSSNPYNTSYKTLNQCEEECMNEIQCAGITYMHDLSQCHKYLEAQSYNIAVNTTLVVKFCPSTGSSTSTFPTPFHNTLASGCYFQRTSNFTIVGSAPYNISFGTLSQCEEECMNEIKCAGITYMHDYSQCRKYLEARSYFTAINTTLVVKFCPSTDSSTSTSPTPLYTPASGCYFQRSSNFTIVGSAPYNISFGTLSQCEEECMNEIKCAGITYMHDYSQCRKYLEARSYFTAINTTLGVKFCPSTNLSTSTSPTPLYTPASGCYFQRSSNFTIVGSAPYNISFGTLSQCEEECMNEVKCAGITYMHDYSQCRKYLEARSYFTAINTTLVVKFCPSTDLSTSTSPTPLYTPASGCYFQRSSNWTIVGSAPYNISFGTLSQCEEECMNEIKCAGITYMHDYSQCRKYLEARSYFTAINITLVVKFCPSTNLSTSTSPTPLYTPASGCYFQRSSNFTIVGSAPYNISFGTLSQCEEECMNEIKCAGIMYMHDYSQCRKYLEARSYFTAINTTLGVKFCPGISTSSWQSSGYSTETTPSWLSPYQTWSSSPAYWSTTIPTSLPDGCFYSGNFVCNRLGYIKSRMPNTLGQFNVTRAQTQILYLQIQVFARLSAPCVDLIQRLTCSMYFPLCNNGSVTQTCQSSCYDILHLYDNQDGVCYMNNQNVTDFLMYYCGFLPKDNCTTSKYNCQTIDARINMTSTLNKSSASTYTTSPWSTGSWLNTTTQQTGAPFVLRIRSLSSTGSTGILELSKDGVFGEVCYHFYFTDAAASIACKSLGFSGGWRTGPFAVQLPTKYQMICNRGNTIGDCYAYSISSCPYNQVAGIHCYLATPTCDFNVRGSDCGYNLGAWKHESNLLKMFPGSSNVTSPTFNSTDARSVRFFFKIHNSMQMPHEMASLRLHVVTTNTQTVTDFSGAVPNQWLSRCVKLPANQEVQLIFEGQASSIGYSSTMTALSLDNVTISEKECTVFPMENCTFNDHFKCPYEIKCPKQQIPTPYMWRLYQASTTNVDLGNSFGSTLIRLVNGNSAYQGRVEVFYDGSWGTVCDDLWDNNDAAVVCGMLGYSRSSAVARTQAFFGQGTGPIMLDNVNCIGTESDISLCPHNGWKVHNCGHSEDAGVVCSGIPTSPVPSTSVDGFNGIDSIDVYLNADASNGGPGDQTIFTLPVNVSADTQIMRVFMKSSLGYNRDFSALQISQYQQEESTTPDHHSVTVWKISHVHVVSWRWICVSLPLSGQSHLQFKATRGMTSGGDIAIYTIYMSNNPCPHPVTCNFEDNTDCDYHVWQESSWFYWARGSGSNLAIVSLGAPSVDQSLGTKLGHYMYTSSCANSTASYKEGTITKFSTPTFTTTSDIQLKFYYHMNGSGMGVLNVYEYVDRQQTLKFSKAGDQGGGWYLACLDIAGGQDNVSVIFSAIHGPGCSSIFALDDITVEKGKCPYPLVDVMCDVENPDLCQYESNCTEGSTFQWRRASGQTPSLGTGPSFDASGSPLGHYLYVEGSNGKVGDVSYLWFPVLHTASTTGLQFYYHMTGHHIGTLKVVTLDVMTGNLQTLWKKEGEQLNGWNKQCINIPAMESFQIYFVAIKGSGHKSDIAIDDIKLENTSCPDVSATCDFENSFLCGYMNVLGYNYSTWRRTSYINSNYQPSRSRIGHYMLSGNNGYSILLSPKFYHSEHTCVRFELYSSGQHVSFMVMVEGTRNGVWSGWIPWKMDSHQASEWVYAQFDIDNSTSKNHRLVFAAQTTSGNIALDNVKVFNGHCPKLECPDDMFACTDRCISKARVCDKIIDCPSREDEITNCNRSISCDFDDSYHCGYVNTTSSRTRLNWLTELVLSGVIIHDHTQNGSTGYFLGFSQAYFDAYLVSPWQHVPVTSCVKFYYIQFGNVQSTVTLYNKETGDNYTATAITHNLITWIPHQVLVSPGTIQLQFFWRPNSGSAGIDDVTVTSGMCPALDCPAGMFACGTRYCLPNRHLCDRKIDCLEGEDEINCDYSISCDFESDNWCGYSLVTAFKRRQGGYFYLPDRDNTHKNYTGHYVYFSSDSGSIANITSPVQNFSDGCLSFFYNMEGGVSSQLYVFVVNNGHNKLAMFTDGVNVRRDEWLKASIPIKEGKIYVLFSVYADSYFSKPSVIAIDDVQFSAGESCPMKACNATTDFQCKDTGTCIPSYLTMDGISDCQDHSDESIKNMTSGLVRLSGGQDPSYGRLEITNNQGIYSSVCEYSWYTATSNTVCRQLGYRAAVKTYYNSQFGQSRTGSYHPYYYSCGSTAASLANCYRYTRYSCSSSSKTNIEAQVSIACSNSECMYGEQACQPGNFSTTCIATNLWCDGNVDCPQSEDEKNCGQCSTSEFQCHNYKCIPLSQRCDSIKQCLDGSDEFRCVRRSKEGNNEVEIWADSSWRPVCHNYIDNTLASYLCSHIGEGSFNSFTEGKYSYQGYNLVPGNYPSTVVPNHKPETVPACYLLELSCGSIECGIPSVGPLPVDAIVSGRESQEGEWPWQVALRRSGSLICGGAIIHPQWILTAAHCVDDYSASYYSIGAGTINKYQFTTEQVKNAQQLYIHPNYTTNDNLDSYIDIALVKLQEPLVYNDTIRPACLTTEREGHTNCYATGWGTTHYEGTTRQLPTILQEVGVVIVNNSKCKESWAKSPNPSITSVQDTVICVDNREPFGPVCYGDSGGPLVCQDKTGRWNLLGITSRTYPGCIIEDHIPSLYSSVPDVIPWINQITGLNFHKHATPSPYTGTLPATSPHSTTRQTSSSGQSATISPHLTTMQTSGSEQTANNSPHSTTMQTSASGKTVTTSPHSTTMLTSGLSQTATTSPHSTIMQTSASGQSVTNSPHPTTMQTSASGQTVTSSPHPTTMLTSASGQTATTSPHSTTMQTSASGQTATTSLHPTTMQTSGSGQTAIISPHPTTMQTSAAGQTATTFPHSTTMKTSASGQTATTPPHSTTMQTSASGQTVTTSPHPTTMHTSGSG